MRSWGTVLRRILNGRESNVAKATGVQDSVSRDARASRRNFVRPMTEKFAAWAGKLSVRVARALARTKRLWSLPKLGAFRPVLSAIGLFVSSRRWLVGAVMVTSALLATIHVGRPALHLGYRESDGSEFLLDDVKSFPAQGGTATVGFCPTIGGAQRPAAVAVSPLPAEPTLGGNTASIEAGQSAAVRRRLESIHVTSARGAWLTGKIDIVADNSSKPAGAAEPPMRQAAVPPAHGSAVR
jgi:hypothetical protein